jgi:hypothetical protein
MAVAARIALLTQQRLAPPPRQPVAAAPVAATHRPVATRVPTLKP